MNSSMRLKSGWMGSQKYFILLLMKTPRPLQTVHWQRRWVCWKIEICSFVYLSFKWVRLKTFWPPLVYSQYCVQIPKLFLKENIILLKAVSLTETRVIALLIMWDFLPSNFRGGSENACILKQSGVSIEPSTYWSLHSCLKKNKKKCIHNGLSLVIQGWLWHQSKARMRLRVNIGHQ